MKNGSRCRLFLCDPCVLCGKRNGGQLTMEFDKLCLIAAGVLLASGAHAQNVQRGQKLFEECAACHSTERGVNGVGPSLAGTLGRKAGEGPDFRYSPALRRSGITWNASALND